MSTPVLDPVRRQVVANRLHAITDAMRVALQAVSGSPTVTEASDFFTGLYLPDGEFATMGYQVTFEAPPVGALIRTLTARGVTLRPGDMFIGNDPYIGALHQNDLQMAAPLFDADGTLVAWAGVMAHQTDMGGMDFASWSPKAREIWQEGLRIPAVKLLDRGELRGDVLEMILAATPPARGRRARRPGLRRHPEHRRRTARRPDGPLRRAHGADRDGRADRRVRGRAAGPAAGAARRRGPHARLPGARRAHRRPLRGGADPDQAR